MARIWTHILDPPVRSIIFDAHRIKVVGAISEAKNHQLVLKIQGERLDFGCAWRDGVNAGTEVFMNSDLRNDHACIDWT